MELYIFAHISIENKYAASDPWDLSGSVSILAKQAMQLLCHIFAGVFPDAIPNFPYWSSEAIKSLQFNMYFHSKSHGRPF